MKANLKQLSIIAASSFLFAGCCVRHHTARWEYKVVREAGNLSSLTEWQKDQEALMNAMGKHGWIFVSQSDGIFYFKRPAREDNNNFLRPRAEVDDIRKQSVELAQSREEKRSVHAPVRDAAQAGAKPSMENDPELHASYAKMNDAKLLMVSLHIFALKNQDRFPTDLGQITNYSKSINRILNSTNGFELVLQGSINTIRHPDTTIAVRERETTLVQGKRYKIYGFADGHAELKAEPPEGFVEWEKARIIPSQPDQQ